jgi:hypothetical protein
MVSLPFNSTNDIILSLTCALFTHFVNVSGLEGRKVYNYLTAFYIIYQNYYQYDGAYGAHGGGEGYIQHFGWEA